MKINLNYLMKAFVFISMYHLKNVKKLMIILNILSV